MCTGVARWVGLRAVFIQKSPDPRLPRTHATPAYPSIPTQGVVQRAYNAFAVRVQGLEPPTAGGGPLWRGGRGKGASKMPKVRLLWPRTARIDLASRHQTHSVPGGTFRQTIVRAQTIDNQRRSANDAFVLFLCRSHARKVVPAQETTEGTLCIEMRIRMYHHGAMSKLLEKLSKVGGSQPSQRP